MMNYEEAEFKARVLKAIVFKNMGIVSAKRQGLEMIYKLEIPCVLEFLDCAKRVLRESVETQFSRLGAWRTKDE